MTICIGAICEGDSVIMASDKMMTLSVPSTEFERNESKIRILTPNSAIATAGDALIHEEILRRVKPRIAEKHSTTEIANLLVEGYVAERRRLAEGVVLLPIGLDMEEFYEKQRSLLPEIAMQAVQRIGGFQFNFSMVIGGIDSEGAHIFLVQPPGISRCMDAIGQCAIGTGDIHAFQTFITYEYERSTEIQKAILIVFEAKKRAEKAAGVGKKTDLLVLRRGKEPYSLTDSQIGELEKFHREEIEKRKEDLKKFGDVSLDLP